MKVEYNTFIENINDFILDNYTSNKNNLFDNNFNKFYEYYLILEDEEKKKYNANIIKFKKSMNEQKNIKYLKISREPEEYKKIYDINNIQDENEKISIKIRSYLNKISNDTYEKICSKLIDELITIKNPEIFKILSKEITTKCIFDNKYRILYINLCNKIWDNKEIHLNLIEIKKKNYDYYWNILNNIEIHGPFNNENIIKNDVFKKINFKRFFLNYIQNLFINKNIDFEKLKDEEFFEEKKKILSLCELISILYIRNHINFDIINIVFINLLHLNNNKNQIKEIELELCYSIIYYIYENTNKNIKLNEYYTIFNEYVETLFNYMKINISKRANFFINEIINILHIFLNKKDKNKIYNQSKLNNQSKINITFFDSLIKKNLEVSYNLFKKEDNIENNISKIINLLLDKTKNYDTFFLIDFLKNIKEEYTIFFDKIINNIIENIDDIILDVPNIKETFSYLIEKVELNNIYLIKLEDKIKECLDSDSDSDIDSDSYSINNNEIKY
jgi:hypothetical protein